ncbi:MAG: 4-hydroxy-tetrahydrodipicolinate synthase [Oscillospiraceae bacterium]|nr:4-hydroxy-tetrahydrodipicolinate synthase [Oscillospiraceae bacterium]
MKKPVFTGACVAIVTPFLPNGEVDFDTLGNLIEFQIAKGTDAITICGTTGEKSTLADGEHKECIEYCVKKVAGRVPVIAGTGGNDTRYSLSLCQHAESVGADALLCVTPYYNKASQKGLIKHFEYLADNVNIPIILYNVPSRTGMTIAPATYAELAKHPNINGTKEASGDFSLVAKIRAACGDELNVWSGNDDQIVPMMALGAKGVISVLSNVVPDVVANMTHAALAGDFAAAAKLQLEYLRLANDLFLEVNPIPVKTALGMMGLCSPDLRLPLCEMGDATAKTLHDTLAAYGLLK